MEFGRRTEKISLLAGFIVEGENEFTRGIGAAVNPKTLVQLCNRAKWIAVNARRRKIFVNALPRGGTKKPGRKFSTSRAQEIQE